MSSSVKLQAMFSYSFIPIIILLIIILCLILYFLLNKQSKGKKPIKVVKPINVEDIKKKYIISIDHLWQEISENKIDSRQAYQNLSKLIRHFIFEVTGIKVQNYTLEEIKRVNMPVLTSLITEYYHPEFALGIKGDIMASIKRTREVILKWQ